MNEIWLILTILFSFCLYYILKNRLAIFFPSSKRMIDTIIKFADIKKSDVFYDLGSGDGRILLQAAKKGIKVVGIEKNYFLNKIARKKLKNYKNAKIIQKNIFDQDLSKATIIVAYLSRFLMPRLQKKIEKQCKKGTKIILVYYKFKNWKSLKEKKIGHIKIRLYKI